MSNYTYWNLWTTPIFESFDDEYETIREDAVQYCISKHGGQERSHVAFGIKSKLYESNFSFFKESDNSSIKHIENKMKTTFEDIFLNYWVKGLFTTFTKIYHFKFLKKHIFLIFLKKPF